MSELGTPGVHEDVLESLADEAEVWDTLGTLDINQFLNSH